MGGPHEIYSQGVWYGATLDFHHVYASHDAGARDMLIFFSSFLEYRILTYRPAIVPPLAAMGTHGGGGWWMIQGSCSGTM